MKRAREKSAVQGINRPWPIRGGLDSMTSPIIGGLDFMTPLSDRVWILRPPPPLISSPLLVIINERPLKNVLQFLLISAHD